MSSPRMSRSDDPLLFLIRFSSKSPKNVVVRIGNQSGMADGIGVKITGKAVHF